MRRSKQVTDVRAALEGLQDGARIMVSGFGLSGNPEALIEGVREVDARHLTLIANNAGAMGLNLATWIADGRVDTVICSYLGNNEVLQSAWDDGRVDVQLTPQGTLVERMRAAGAGLAAFYTPTGAGTELAVGKEERDFDGVPHVLEHALHADFALVRVHEADPFGNARFYRTSRNFGQAMATAARVAVLEADNVVALGDIDPDHVHLSGGFVQRVLHVPQHDDVIEHRTVRPR